jgi:molybdenum cofactor sulfurtransferase
LTLRRGVRSAMASEPEAVSPIAESIVFDGCSASTLDQSESAALQRLQERIPSFGYGGQLAALRAREYSRLATQGLVYLDAAGAALYGEAQLRAATAELLARVAGNPHSQGPASASVLERVEAARSRVLRYFGASEDEFSVVFTSGATAALALLADAFPWTRGSLFAYTQDNHTSVLGMRQVASSRGAHARCIGMLHQPEDIAAAVAAAAAATLGAHDDAPCLLALPCESNFSGARYDVQAIAAAVKRVAGARWVVLADTAKSAASGGLELARGGAVDAAVVSFYKLFGYPTGLGALVVRNSVGERLHKAYFGGGTVELLSAVSDLRAPRRRLCERLEDGTAHFLGILALDAGFDLIDRLGISAIRDHTDALRELLYTELAALRHASTGRLVCEFYGRHEAGRAQQGPVVTFNVRRGDGSFVGYAEVERLAAQAGIQLRTGCFCNVGACHFFLGLSEEDVRAQHRAGHVCWDRVDLVDGRPTGAVRASLGFFSAPEDVWALVRFVRRQFLEAPPAAPASAPLVAPVAAPRRVPASSGSSGVLQSLTLFPVKSCAGTTVARWPLAAGGLTFDREWAVVNASGVALTQTRHPRMCLLQPSLDLDAERLIITAPGAAPLAVPLRGREADKAADGATAVASALRVCSIAREGTVYGPEVREWFTRALGHPCSLARMADAVPREASARSRPGEASSSYALSFANEGQYLLVSLASAEALRAELEPELRAEPLDAFLQRFRPNLVVRGLSPFEEERWRAVRVGGARFRVLGPCFRCTMVNVDQASASTDSRLFSALSARAKACGAPRPAFGVLLVRDEAGSALPIELQRGDQVVGEL